MQKILLALNALNLNKSSIDFATYIANKTKSKIVAVFLEQPELAEAIMPTVVTTISETEDLIECDCTEVTLSNELVEKNKQQFILLHCIGCSVV